MQTCNLEDKPSHNKVYTNKDAQFLVVESQEKNIGFLLGVFSRNCAWLLYMYSRLIAKIGKYAPRTSNIAVCGLTNKCRCNLTELLINNTRTRNLPHHQYSYGAANPNAIYSQIL